MFGANRSSAQAIIRASVLLKMRGACCYPRLAFPTPPRSKTRPASPLARPCSFPSTSPWSLLSLSVSGSVPCWGWIPSPACSGAAGPPAALPLLPRSLSSGQ